MLGEISTLDELLAEFDISCQDPDHLLDTAELLLARIGKRTVPDIFVPGAQTRPISTSLYSSCSPRTCSPATSLHSTGNSSYVGSLRGSYIDNALPITDLTETEAIVAMTKAIYQRHLSGSSLTASLGPSSGCCSSGHGSFTGTSIQSGQTCPIGLPVSGVNQRETEELMECSGHLGFPPDSAIRQRTLSRLGEPDERSSNIATGGAICDSSTVHAPVFSDTNKIVSNLTDFVVTYSGRGQAYSMIVAQVGLLGIGYDATKVFLSHGKLDNDRSTEV
ncbi:unnamed protein product [Protopolystoma xenopodis]|uniref:Uncharacterized protein n=1 Tax=Protopolystoma xenopodis TaxID=117903 RepID=A0A448XL65_9PLAT|nr:unnamed protein product [Protopolystoma xenopodis]